MWFLIIIACNKSEIENPNSTSNMSVSYYPNNVGKYIIYEVKKINYKFSEPADCTFYQLKEVLADTFVDLENKKAYKLERFIRYKRKSAFLQPNVDSTWKIDSVWNARITTKHILVYENNVPFVKLTFPLAVNKSWNGNLYNNIEPENYKVIETKLTSSAKISWENSVTIMHKNDSSAINMDLRYEIYSQKIGLVYVKKLIYDDACKFNFDGKPCIPGDKIANGIYYEQNAIRYEIPK